MQFIQTGICSYPNMQRSVSPELLRLILVTLVLLAAIWGTKSMFLYFEGLPFSGQFGHRQDY